MKVLQIYKDYYPPVKGGIEGHINLLARGLKRRGIEVEALVSNTGPRLERLNIEGIPVTRVPEFGRITSAPLNPNLSLWLRRLGRDADILHFHFPNPTAEISYLLSGLDRKVVVTYHSDIVRQARLGFFYSPFLRRFLDKAQAIIATSPNYIRSSEVLESFQHKCRVIPLGIDPARFTCGPQEAEEVAALRERYGPGFLLFVGRFRYYKGLHVLIEALKEVEARLVLIGGGPLAGELRRQVAVSGLEEKVFFPGELPDREVVTHLHACDLFVLPSILRSEAFGIVLLEAMACGKPVISTELGTGTSFVNQHKETGLVVPPNDTAALAEAVNFLLAYPEIRDKYGQEGRERVNRHFSSEAMVDDIVRTYGQL